MRLIRLRQASLSLAACGTLAGCATLLEVRPLATGRSDVSAYELIGADLAALRREAQRLCPQGGEIVRQAAHGQMPENIDGRLRGWMNGASAWMDPPQRAAQMMVVCRESAGQNLLQAAAAGDAASAAGSGAAGEVSAGVPVGPLNVEW